MSGCGGEESNMKNKIRTVRYRTDKGRVRTFYFEAN